MQDLCVFSEKNLILTSRLRTVYHPYSPHRKIHDAESNCTPHENIQIEPALSCSSTIARVFVLHGSCSRFASLRHKGILWLEFHQFETDKRI
jgi:hypothetical protein